MDHTNHILVTVGSVVFTAFAVAYAVHRRFDLERRHRGSPEYDDNREFCNDQIFFEVVRFGMHCFIVGLIVWAARAVDRHASVLRPPGLMIINVLLNGFVFVSVLLGVKSAWNLWRRRRRYNRYKLRHALKVQL